MVGETRDPRHDELYNYGHNMNTSNILKLMKRNAQFSLSFKYQIRADIFQNIFSIQQRNILLRLQEPEIPNRQR